MAKDPILRGTETLVGRGYASLDDIEHIRAAARAEIEAAVEFGRNSPWPDLAELTTDVYSD